jgi:hypothetical protein
MLSFRVNPDFLAQMEMDNTYLNLSDVWVAMLLSPIH